MAALATVLSSTISPAVKQQQDAARAAKQKIRAGLQQACDENIQGFEKTYRILLHLAPGLDYRCLFARLSGSVAVSARVRPHQPADTRITN